MKKHLLTGAAMLVLGGFIASCSHDDVNYSSIIDGKLKAYQEVFVDAYGKIDPNQTWGFTNLGESSDGSRGLTRAMTRSQVAPACPDITKPYDEAWVATYNQTAKEPNSTNVTDNYDNTSYAYNYDVVNNLDWDNGGEDYYNQTNSGKSWDEQVAYALANHPEWLNYNADETFVRNFKITGTWNGDITVAATEGLTDGVANGNERTVVVTGTWNITSDQRIGSLGKIIIANGGTVNVAEDVTLNMVNQARLVVLPGGKLTGAGKVEVNNGNAAGLENYNGGTIDVAVFNNNFGKFYNYGKFLVNEYDGGAQESNFYNHALVSIDHFGIYDSSTANARIFNACQFYVRHDARIRNYEGIMGSSLIVDGQLMFSSSEDDTSTPTYVGLAAGALVKANTLYNNGTSWTGPTSGYAALEIVDQIDYLNWEQDAPQTGGYFENNIYVRAGTWENVPDGNGMQQKTDNGTEYYTMSQADYKFWTTLANCRGNNGVTKVGAGNTELLPADDDFEKGVEGCTPGFKGDTTPSTPNPDNTTIPVDQGTTTTDRVTIVTTTEEYETTELIEQGRVFCEDLGQISSNDLDFNDVVFDAYVYRTTPSTITIVTENGTETSRTTEYGTPTYNTTIILLAAGGTLQLSLAGVEVHNKLGGNPTTTIINTITSAEGAYGNKYYTHDPVELGTDFDYSSIVEIPIRVLYGNGETLELTAEQGWAPHKILVPIGTKWCKERQNIAAAYTKFHAYVNSSLGFWEGDMDTDKLYYHPKDTYQPRSTEPVVVLKSRSSYTEYREGETTTIGGYQGETVLSRELR